MQPTPCLHCGYNYMRRTDFDDLRLCNSCEVRENIRNPKEKKMETVDILVKCPTHIYRDIEEKCINIGTHPSDYLMTLYYDDCSRFLDIKEHEEKGGNWKEGNEEKIIQPNTKKLKK